MKGENITSESHTIAFPFTLWLRLWVSCIRRDRRRIRRLSFLLFPTGTFYSLCYLFLEGWWDLKRECSCIWAMQSCKSRSNRNHKHPHQTDFSLSVGLVDNGGYCRQKVLRVQFTSGISAVCEQHWGCLPVQKIVLDFIGFLKATCAKGYERFLSSA